MFIIAEKYKNEAISLLASDSYIEYISYFKILKLKHAVSLLKKAAEIYDLENQHTEAGKCYFECANTLAKYDPEKAAQEYFNSGKCYESDDISKAILSLLYSYDIYKKLKHYEMAVNCCAYIANMYFTQTDYKNAMTYYENCIIYNNKLNKQDLNIVYYENVGVLSIIHLELYSHAICNYDALIDILAKHHNYRKIYINVLITILLRLICEMKDRKTNFISTHNSYTENWLYKNSTKDFLEQTRNTIYYDFIVVLIDSGKKQSTDTTSAIKEIYTAYSYYKNRLPNLCDKIIEHLISKFTECL